MLVNSKELSTAFTQIEIGNGKIIEVYTLIPLYKEELDFKKQHSTGELLEKFDQLGIEEIIKIGRENVCK